MSVRFAVVALAAVLAVGCASSLKDAGEALSPSPAASGPSPSPPSPTASSPATGATGEGEPAIVVTSPAAGDEIVSPVTISGTADVFEATVSVRIVDASGSELAAGFATATCGSGCRGEFTTLLAFFAETRRPATIEVFESSAEDGSPINLVSIPVVLVPGG